MAKVAKRYTESLKSRDAARKYMPAEAVGALLTMKAVKFDETVDLAVRLGVDPKHADQMVRGSVMLPHGTGRSVRILVIAKGEKEKEAKDAGADITGSDEIVKKIQEGWLEFDKVIATPDMMATVGKLGSILGPRGLMPNPKVGTVTFDVGKAVRDEKKGKLDFKADKAGIVHAIVGKRSFGAEKLLENFTSLMDSIVRAKPSAAKGTYLKSITLSSTMSPGVRVDPNPFTVA